MKSTIAMQIWPVDLHSFTWIAILGMVRGGNLLSPTQKLVLPRFQESLGAW
jgi:hypothetical protein